MRYVHILFSSLHGHGHLYPMLPLAVAAREAGHQVTVATGEGFHPVLSELGLDVVAAGVGIHDAFRSMPATEHGRENLSGEELYLVAAKVFGQALPRSFVGDLMPLIGSLRPALVVHESGNPGAGLAARAAGVPGVCHGFGRVAVGLQEHIGPEIRAFAAELDIELPSRNVIGLGDPYLDICPESLQDKDFIAVADRLALRPVAFADSGELPEFVRHRDRPLVYLTLGTAFGSTDVLRQAVEGLATLDADVLVATGPSVPEGELGGVPGNVTVLPWVPQARLLPHTDLVVHHGGSGTTLATFAAGVPQLLLPQGADQFGNAEMVAGSGAGASLLPADFGAEAVAAQAKRLLGDGLHRRAAGAVAEEIAAMPSPDEFARRLPEFAG